MSYALGDRPRHATGGGSKKNRHRDTRDAGKRYVDEIQDRQAKCKDELGGWKGEEEEEEKEKS